MSTVIETSDKKYAVGITDDGRAEALRYGEKWLDLTGNKFVTTLALDLQEARAERDSYEAQFAQSNVTINELLEAVSNLKANLARVRRDQDWSVD